MEDSAKQNLQDRLLNAVKQCQAHFGGRQEVATESDLRANTLCLEWEAVLTHGHKKPKTNKLLSGFVKVDNLTGVALWPIIRPFISNEERDRFARLRFITSDIGRGRAWLRAAINERTLETYLHSLLSDKNYLNSIYEPHSFLLDEERSTMLPVMAGGLNSIIFSLTVDGEYLNSPLKVYEVPIIDPALRPTPSPTVAANIKPSFALRLGSDALTESSVVAVSNKKSKKKKRKSPSPEIIDTPTNNIGPNNYLDLATPTNKSFTPPTLLPSDICNIGPASTDGARYHDGADTPPSGVASPESTATTNSSSPVGSIQSINSEDYSNISLFNPQTALEATAVVLEATQAIPTTTVVTMEKPSSTVSVATVLSEEEMKEALKVLVRSKENIEEEFKLAQSNLVTERERVQELEKEVEELTQKLHTADEVHLQQKQSLERENDLLREQLKRYVGIVKQHQDEESGGENSDSSKKLSEMAEMYGELMEFNEHLHKSVKTKDSLIVKLVQTLKLASIPLPVSTTLLPREALEPPKIIEVWIPSVIKRGRGPEAHHEYQIYIKLGTEEWNVYRRFAEMFEFHKQLLRNLQGVEEFVFPPKKVIGNKGSQLIEERRKKLQHYLRLVLELCCRPVVKRKDGRVNNAYVTEGMSKEQFVKVLPFFNDNSVSSNTVKTPVQRAPSYSGL